MFLSSEIRNVVISQAARLGDFIQARPLYMDEHLFVVRNDVNLLLRRLREFLFDFKYTVRNEHLKMANFCDV